MISLLLCLVLSQPVPGRVLRVTDQDYGKTFFVARGTYLAIQAKEIPQVFTARVDPGHTTKRLYKIYGDTYLISGETRVIILVEERWPNAKNP